jgi:hypothetical protein
MTEDDEFSWEDPPPAEPSRPKESKYVRLVKQLKKNPDKWALATTGLSRTGAKQLAQRLEFGQYGTKVEASHVQVGDRAKGWHVYARYSPKATGRSLSP